MSITVQFPSIGEVGVYDDGVTEQDIHNDYQQRQYRKSFSSNPVMAIMGLAEHMTSRPTAPTPATVSGSSVIGLAPDQTSALLDRVQRSNEVKQRAYESEVEQARRIEEAQRSREFAAAQQNQQQQFQIQQQQAQDARQDQKEKQSKLEGTVKQDPKTGDWIWTRPDPNTGEPVISVAKPGSNTWEKITGPDGSIMQVQVDATGKMLGNPQTVIAGEGEKINWQEVGSPYWTADGRYVQNVRNPRTKDVETIDLPKPAQTTKSMKLISDKDGKPYFVQNGQLVSIKLPPDFKTGSSGSVDGITEKELTNEIAAVVEQENAGMIEPEEMPAVIARAQERIKLRKSAVSNANAPLGTPEQQSGAGSIFIGKDGKRYRDLGDGTAEEL